MSDILQKNKKIIFALYGESASGKNTVIDYLFFYHKSILNRIVRYTTRSKRENEINALDYYFVSEEKFLDLKEKNKFIEYTKFRGWYYGTFINSLVENKINIGAFDNFAISQLLLNHEFYTIPIYVKTSDKVRLQRSLAREDNPDCQEICRRFLAEKEDFKKTDFAPIAVIENNDDWNNIGSIGAPYIDAAWTKLMKLLPIDFI